MNFFSNFVGEEPKVEDLLRHMDQVLEMGGEDCLAIGSDFDVLFREDSRKELRAFNLFQTCAEPLLAHGFGESLVEKIFHENAYRFVLENVK
ncbi:MAG: membrane dipeptidase [Ruminococcus sp.]